MSAFGLQKNKIPIWAVPLLWGLAFSPTLNAGPIERVPNFRALGQGEAAPLGAVIYNNPLVNEPVADAAVLPANENSVLAIDDAQLSEDRNVLRAAPYEAGALEQRLGEIFDHQGLRGQNDVNRIGFTSTEETDKSAVSPIAEKRSIGFQHSDSESNGPALKSSLEDASMKSRKIGFLRSAAEPAKTPAPPSDPVILLTGFGPFGKFSKNTTQQIAGILNGLSILIHQDDKQRLSTSISGKNISPSAKPKGSPIATYRIVGKVLPASFEKAGDTIEKLVEEIKPAAVLMFGLSGRANKIEVELLAKNIMHSPNLADIDGRKPNLRTIIKRGPSAIMTNAPAGDLVKWLNSKKIPTALSEDAGCFVCNSTFYFALNQVRYLGAKTPTTFIHLPPAQEHLPPDQIQQTPHWPLKNLSDAAMQIVQWVAWHHRTTKQSIKLPQSS